MLPAVALGDFALLDTAAGLEASDFVSSPTSALTFTLALLSSSTYLYEFASEFGFSLIIHSSPSLTIIHRIFFSTLGFTVLISASTFFSKTFSYFFPITVVSRLAVVSRLVGVSTVGIAVGITVGVGVTLEFSQGGIDTVGVGVTLEFSQGGIVVLFS